MSTYLARSVVVAAVALALGCSDPTGPVSLREVYAADDFADAVLYEDATHRIIGLSSFLELDGAGQAVLRSHSRYVEKATLDESIVEDVLQMTYTLDGDRLRTGSMPCPHESCPLSLVADPPDYLVRDGGQRLVELSSSDGRRTFTAVIVTASMLEER